MELICAGHYLLVLWSQAAGDVSSSFLSERGVWEEGGDHNSDSSSCDVVWEMLEQKWAV